MEGEKGVRFSYHAILNNLEQVKSFGVSIHAEKFVFDLVVKELLRDEKMESESWVSLNSTQPNMFYRS